MAKKETIKNLNQNKFFYLFLIVLIWFITYVICQFIFEKKLGWDEVAYLSVARGIAENFDFSARTYTVMGLIKHGYPTHFIHFPIYSLFLALFLKLSNNSLAFAYFSTWLFALGVCIFIYLIILILLTNCKQLAFGTSLFYLFCPGIIRYCDTAMMEQCGNFLLCLFLYLILKDYSKGKITYLTSVKFALLFLVVWIFKSLYVGILIGGFVVLALTFSSGFFKKGELNLRCKFLQVLLISYGGFAASFFLLKKFVFLPVAPMMNFTKTLEANQSYSDFMAGFFHNFPQNLLENLKYFLNYTLGIYFNYPTAYTSQNAQFFVFIPHVIYNGIYFFLFFICIALLFSGWKNLNSLSKLFSIFSAIAIVSFNLIFNVFFSTTYENIWRYNVYYLPLYLCFLAIVFNANFSYKKPFILDHPKVSKLLIALIVVFIYLPLFISMINIQQYFWDIYHTKARTNDEIIKSFIKSEKPNFIYFNDGIHTTFTQYPIKQVMKDATNEQLLRVNKILPEPIEYLFLTPKDWLFQSNKDLIIMSEPILGGTYKMHGFDNQNQVVVYKLK